MTKMKVASIVALTIAALTLSSTFLLQAKTMAEIKFDISKNIIEVARESGIPTFETRDVNGYISYSVADLPDGITAKFARPGYEVAFPHLFALTLYADRKSQNNLAVENATLQFSHSPFKSHSDGQKFAEQIITRMGETKWLRHIESSCPAVSGRSSILDAEGKLEPVLGCAFDPAYRLSSEEWLAMIKRNEIRYQWKGSGVLATMHLSASEDSRGVTYKFFMEFDDIAIKEKSDLARLKEKLAEGDKKGWRSTEKHEKKLKDNQELIKLLESAAVQRGDLIVPR